MNTPDYDFVDITVGKPSDEELERAYKLVDYALAKALDQSALTVQYGNNGIFVVGNDEDGYHVSIRGSEGSLEMSYEAFQKLSTTPPRKGIEITLPLVDLPLA